MEPKTHYARNGDSYVAYQVLGQGSPDLVLLASWFGHVEARWSFPLFARFLELLASFSRLILFDKRGTGLSDPVPLTGLPTLEDWVDDVRTVLDAVESEHATLLASMEGGLMAMLFAATHPGRTDGLILDDAYARFEWAPDYPWGVSHEEIDALLAATREEWGTGDLLLRTVPSSASNPAFRETYARYLRQSASPGAAATMRRMLYGVDIREILPRIQAPTLVMHRAHGPWVRIEHGRYLAEHIPRARFVELPGSDHLIWTGRDDDPGLAEIQEFVTGVRPAPEPDRVLATVIFTDIVGSTKRAAELGDRAWHDLREAHHSIVRAALNRFNGREVKTMGDGFLATFDGPARAVRCARALVEEVRGLGLEIRAGVHTGEVEVMNGDVGGIAVHIAARISALADAGEVLVSGTVKDLVVGSGIGFLPRGSRVLKGVPGEWPVYAVEG